ncbi:MAG: carotenoid 1,2-hydratase [Nitrospirae bacterium]|nr:carotenoid 1,2-hydratase [Nitrospirota bacterium]
MSKVSGVRGERKNVMRLTWMMSVILILVFPKMGWEKEFKTAEPGYIYHFPADHGSHESYQIEWWYFTGHLYDKKGNQTGFELTFFRTGIADDAIRRNPSRWKVDNIYSAHFALSHGATKKFWFSEKMSRDALGRAGVKQDHFEVWIDRWKGEEKKGDFRLSASEGFGKNRKEIELLLTTQKPAVIHGEKGVSPKDEADLNRSHYYSLTRLKTSGRVIWNGEEKEVEGISWMDHEFGSHPLLPSQSGWDWFSIQLNNQTELMLYQIRNKNGSAPFSFGTLIESDGSVISLRQKDFTLRPKLQWKSSGGGIYPVGWDVLIPDWNISLSVVPIFQDQELTVFGGKMRYWEGSVAVTGFPASGNGYLELTGYARDFASLFSQ